MTIKQINSVEAEMAILGSVVLERDIDHKLDEVNEDMFGNSDCRRIYKIMKDLYKNKEEINIPAIMAKVPAEGRIVYQRLLSEMAAVSQSFYIDSYIKTLKDIYIRKNFMKIIVEMNYNLAGGKDVLSTYNIFETESRQLLQENVQVDDGAKTVVHKVLDYLENTAQVGFKSGVPIFDKNIGGLIENELTTIAAKSSVGKTSLAVQISLNATEQGKKVLIISREMSAEQILMRTITKKTGVSSMKMKYKNLSQEEWSLIMKYLGKVASENLIHINDSVSTISGIKQKVRDLKPDLLIVDYVQLLTSDVRYDNREKEVAGFSRELKNITQDFHIPVIQLSQLNDEMRDCRPYGDRPMRESKALFHDSSNVIYIHEPVGNDFEKDIDEYNLDRNRVRQMKKQGIKFLEIIIAKARDGGVARECYWYNGPRLHFEAVQKL